MKTQKNSWDATKASILTMAVDFYNNRNGLKLDDYHVRSLLLNDEDHNDILLAYLDGALAFDKYESRFSEQDIDEEVPPVIAASNRLLSGFPFSYTGLFARLKFEEFSDEDALYAVENCGADWNEQASRLAHIYADHNSLSRDLLISQLKYEGFTEEQAAYGADSVGLEE
ncbi:MAG: Ltp family lipoprotein [Lachnospiraceae bacterium]|nr:Ltp family lipoprotein [Lachnospiraceae bacterium]